METLALMGKKRGALGSLAFLSVSVIILKQGLGPKLGPDSVMETPVFKAGLLQHREGLWTGSGVAAWVGRKGFLPLTLSMLKGPFSACVPSPCPSPTQSLGDSVQMWGAGLCTQQQCEYNQVSLNPSNLLTSLVPPGIIQ